MFSVIVPIYKVEKYIRDCINSIITQSYRDMELILVDDGSPDNSAVIAEEIVKNAGFSNYKLIRTENRGVSAARNTGIENSTGDYIIMVDADDVLVENFLFDFYEEIKKHPDSDIISCGFEILHEDGRKESDPYSDQTVVCDRVKAQEHFFNRSIKFLLPALALKRSFIAQNSIRFDEKVRYSEDVQFIWRCLAYNKADIVHIEKGNYKYILHPGSTMTASGIQKILTFCGGMERLYDEIKELLCENVSREIMGRMYFSMLHGATKMMTYKTFKELYLSSDSKKYVKQQFSSGSLKVKLVCFTLLICNPLGYKLMRKF